MADERPKRQRTVRSCTVGCLNERVKGVREEFVIPSSRGKTLQNVFQNNDLKVTWMELGRVIVLNINF